MKSKVNELAENVVLELDAISDVRVADSSIQSFISELMNRIQQQAAPAPLSAAPVPQLADADVALCNVVKNHMRNLLKEFKC